MNGVATLADVLAIETHAPPEDAASTYEVLRRAAERAPTAPALSFFATAEGHAQPVTWAYRDLLARVTQAANFFHRLGATKDSVIAYVLPNLPETHAVIWGGQAAGIVFALNPMLEGAALEALLDRAGAEILVTLAPSPGADLWQKLAPRIERVASLRHVVLVDPARGTGPSAPLPAVPPPLLVHDLHASMAREPSDALTSKRVPARADPSSMFCTGGTTGLPKIAKRTHGNEVENAWSVAQAMGDAMGPGTVVLCGLPLFHVNAVLVTGLLPFSRGAHVLLATPHGYRSPDVVKRFWEIVAHHRVTFFSGVPTLYASLLQTPNDGHDVSSLKFALCGAAPMPTRVFRSFEERFGVKILEGYGLTEATCVSSVNPVRGERRVGSIGLRLPGQAMKTVILDADGRYVRDAADGEVGAVVVSGLNVFAGYLDPSQNERLFVDCHDDRRWLDTGDLGRRDADGYFWLTGRRKELIIRGGHNLDPAAIEEPLHRHPSVALAAAVARPDAHAGEVPVAYVELRSGANVTEDELLQFLQREITERAAVPKHVRVLKAMPLTPVGKIAKVALKKLEAKDALESALAEAGVRHRGLSIVEEPSRGLVARLEVSSNEENSAGAKVLGAFTLPFTVVGGSS